MLVQSPMGAIEESEAVSWTVDGTRVESAFRVEGATAAFDVGNYDRSRTLIVDPWATFHGGSAREDLLSVACDAQGNVYATGSTSSADFPVLAGLQMTLNGGQDAMIVKYSGSGQVLWATYYGGSGDYESSASVAVHPSGDIVVGGMTNSVDFPVQNAFQPFNGGGSDSFLLRLTPGGTRVWATFFGGSSDEGAWWGWFGQGLGCDAAGNIFFQSSTWSTDLPVIGAYQSTLGGGADAYLIKVTASGTHLWSTYFGGSSRDIGKGLGVTPQGTIAISGRTESTNLPLTHAHQSVYGGGGQDGYAAEFNTSGQLLWSSYLGGNGNDESRTVAVDISGALYFQSGSRSTDMVTVNPMQASLDGGTDIHIIKYAATSTPQNGRSIEWATYLGGTGDDGGGRGSIQVNEQGNILLVGSTWAADFPIKNAVQPTFAGWADAFVLVMSSYGSIQWSTYYGGSGQESAKHGVFTPANDVVVVGSTNRPDFPVVNPAQPTWGGGIDGFLFQLPSQGLVVTPPQAPDQLTAAAISPTRIALSWTDNSDNETWFVIEWESTPGTWVRVDSAMVNSTAHTVVNLQPETEHSFRVRAANSQYESDPTNVASATTPAFDPPINLTATAHSSEEIKLAWQDVTNGEDGFVIEFCGMGQAWSIADTVSAGTEQHMLSGLDPNTTYEFRLRAYAGSISTAYSNTAQATTLLFLQAPTNLDGVLMSETYVALTWEDNADGETSYEIEHQEDDGDWMLLRTEAENTTMYDAQGLTPNTTNAFRVRAVGPNAASAYSNVYSVRTRMKPAAPRNLTASAVNHISIRVTWERGSENEDGYEMERKTPGCDWALLTTAGPGDGDILDENLEMTTQYCYRVRAENDLGYSGWSNEACATTTDLPVPDAPFGLRAEADGPTSITLNWVAPSPNYAETFEIEQSLTGNENDFSRLTAEADGKVRTHTLTGLEPQTEYCYRIRAVNRSGASGYSNIASATTQDSDEPFRPHNFHAVALGEKEISLTWEMPDPSNEDGFELQRSLTWDEGDFTSLSPKPAQGSRQYSDSGLTTGTTYYYRLRSYNSFGHSAWTDTVSATTQKEVLTPELRAAIEAKQKVISEVETLIPEGTAELATLRNLLGHYPRGYDENAAETLIARWKSEGPDDAARATEAMKRFTIFEEALRDSRGDDDAIPAIPGAADIAAQAGRAPGIATKNLIALALAWKQERDHLGTEHPWINAAMADVILSLEDNMQTLLALMDAERDGDRATFTDAVLKQYGEVEDVTAYLMLKALDYWQERMLGLLYLPATQPLVAENASRTEQLDYTGTESEAKTKRDVFFSDFRSEVDALGTAFSDYGRICYGLDAAYGIGQTAGTDEDIFLLRLKGLRPRLVDGMHDAIANADIPVARALYLTSQEHISGLGSLPASLGDAGEAIFDPVNNENVSDNHRRGEIDATAPLRHLARNSRNTESITSDRNLLIELRGKVLDEDTDYITASFDALRRSGQEMIAEVASLERPLLGIVPAGMYVQESLRADYYGFLARAQLLKTRRAVLSVALADYALGSTTQKQTELVAEIDSIIGPLDGAVDDLTNLVTAIGSLITLPVLSLDDIDIIRAESAVPTRCFIRFTVKNIGAAETASATATLKHLTSGVTGVDPNVFALGTLPPEAMVRDSMAVDIAAGITHVMLSMNLESGGRSFVERRSVLVPQTTGVETVLLLPASCRLHRNSPNPFNPVTTIRFELPRPMEVSLIVTDALGREVTRLFDRTECRSGLNTILYNARSIPSGVYFYRLETPDGVFVRKMVLVR
ncbi:MAG: fibronectin type III domain-containing protein [Bacteroidetes bacterium]|nr:fibronectin type III domain-containing protein [Bacteroidota bacterium]